MAAHEENGFGVDVAGINIDRFRSASGQLPDYIKGTEEFINTVAQMTREKDGPKYFVDSEQASLEIPETVRPQQISTKIVNDKVLKLQEEEIERREEMRMQRLAALRKVLSQIYVWRRPQQICQYPSFFVLGNKLLDCPPQGKLVGPNDVTYLPKFKEGIFDDGFFWTAVSMVATKRDCFANLFMSTAEMDIGMTTFQFYHVSITDDSASEWKCVTIDDQIPCQADYTPVIGKTNDKNELWATYLEKAYAKFLGSYSMLHTGDTWEAVVHLTGGRCKLHNWDSEKVSVPSSCIVWWLVNENNRLGLLQSTVFLDREEDDEGAGEGVRVLSHFGDDEDARDDDETFHIWNQTACTVLETYEVVQQGPHQGLQLLKLRNSFGKIEWNGDWSNDSPTWTKEMREQLNHKVTDDYVTWIKIDDFVRQYNTLLTVSHFKGAPTAFFDTLPTQQEGTLPFHAHQYLITIVDPRAGTADEQTKKKEKKSKGRAAVVIPDLGLEDEPDEDDRPEDDHVVSTDMASIEQAEEEKADKTTTFSFAAMKQEVERETQMARKKKAEEDSQGPKYTLNVYLSQPRRDVGAGLPKEAEVELFKVKGRQLQTCQYVDTEYGMSDAGDVTAYQFVQNNKLKMNEEKTDSPYEMTRTAALGPGYYVLTAHQQFHKDDVMYCLHLSTTDDADMPTGYQMQVEFIGTCAAPKVEPTRRVAGAGRGAATGAAKRKMI